MPFDSTSHIPINVNPLPDSLSANMETAWLNTVSIEQGCDVCCFSDRFMALVVRIMALDSC